MDPFLFSDIKRCGEIEQREGIIQMYAEFKNRYVNMQAKMGKFNLTYSFK